MPSIRRHLMIVLAAGFALLILGTGFVMANVLEARITDEFDVALEAKAKALVALTEQEGEQIQLDYEPSAFPEFERADKPDYFAFWLDDGRLLLKSRHLQSELPRQVPASRTPRVANVLLPDGRAGRLVQIDYVPALERDADEPESDTQAQAPASPPAERRGITLVVARSRERLDDLLGGMLMAILGLGGVTSVLAGFFVWRALARGLRPIDRIASQVARLDAEQLEQRVGLSPTPRELAPITSQLNALLERLEQSFERERRFAGNVAHELRTPIAELRTLAEIGGRWPGDEASVAAFFDDVEAIAGRMEAVVADLLLLARCQAGIEIVERSPVGLRDALLDAWTKQGAPARQEGASVQPALRLDLEVPPDLVLESDAGKLGLILTNVLGNALTYGRSGGVIHCAAAQTGTAFRLEISNPADVLDPDELARLTEPFWRKDAARASSDHAGLGLSVVSELATLLGLSVHFDQDAAGTFRVRVEGPARGRARQPATEVGIF